MAAADLYSPRKRASKARAICALIAAALASVFALALVTSSAHANEVKYIGNVYWEPAIAEDGYPAYNEDGTPVEEAYVTLYGIEGTSGTVQIPESFDVTTKDSSGAEAVVENVSPVSINIVPQSSGDADLWGSSDVTGIDLTKCTRLEALMIQSVPYIKDVDISDLSQLKSLTLTGGSFSSLECEGCDALERLTLSGSDAYGLFDFSNGSLEGIKDLSISSCPDLTEFDGKQFPSLERLYLAITGLTTIDLSSCSKLEDVTLTSNADLKALDVDSIPSNVAKLYCAHNNIEDTEALAERFGEGNVLPQGVETTSTSQLNLLDERLANGSLLPNDTLTCNVSGTFRPSGSVSGSWYQEDPQKRDSLDNYTITSSNPDVVAITKTPASEGRNQDAIQIEVVKAGKTTLTATYEFEGEYRTYFATESVDFTFAAEPNYIKTIDCESETATVKVIEKCAICDEFHGSDVEIPLGFTAENPELSPSPAPMFTVESSDDSIVTGNAWMIGDEAALSIHPLAAGEADLTITATYPEGIEAPIIDPITITVNMEPYGDPILKSVGEYKKAFYPDPDGGQSIDLISTKQGAIDNSMAPFYYEFEEGFDELLSKSGHYNALQGGFGDSEEGMFAFESSDEEVIAFSEGNSRASLIPKTPGKATVAVTDPWGNEESCDIVLLDFAAGAKSISLAETEITLEVGEELRLEDLLKDVDKLDPAVANLILGSFESSDGRIAPVGQQYDPMTGMPTYSVLYGRSAGDAEIAVSVYSWYGDVADNILVGKGVTFEIGTLKVHVVEPSEPVALSGTVKVAGDPCTGMALKATAELGEECADAELLYQWFDAADGKAIGEPSSSTTFKIPEGSLGESFYCVVTDGSGAHESSLKSDSVMAAHTFGDWETVKEATATDPGTEQRVCSACDYMEQREIPATGEEPETPVTSFKDVDEATYHVDAIAWLEATGVSTGFEDGTFRPMSDVARADMAAFLYRVARLSGEPAYTPDDAIKAAFPDVDESTPHANEIWWLASKGISTGFPDGDFRPYDAIARCDMAAFLQRLGDHLGVADPAAGPSFHDVNASTPHAVSIAWLSGTGISTGFEDGTFRPYDTIKRCDMAAFLQRLNAYAEA